MQNNERNVTKRKLTESRILQWIAECGKAPLDSLHEEDWMNGTLVNPWGKQPPSPCAGIDSSMTFQTSMLLSERSALAIASENLNGKEIPRRSGDVSFYQDTYTSSEDTPQKDDIARMQPDQIPQCDFIKPDNVVHPENIQGVAQLGQAPPFSSNPYGNQKWPILPLNIPSSHSHRGDEKPIKEGNSLTVIPQSSLTEEIQLLEASLAVFPLQDDQFFPGFNDEQLSPRPF